MSLERLARLRALQGRLDSSTGLDERSRACEELLELGRRWPKEPARADGDQEGKAFEHLSRQLVKLADSQQADLVDAFEPLREDLRWRMEEAAEGLNCWLGEAGAGEAGSPQRLEERLRAIDEAPLMRWYKRCPDLQAKARFLLALASVMRAIGGASAELQALVQAHPPVARLVGQLTDRFFVIPEHGSVLTAWHDGRLHRYNRTLWRAARRASERMKDDLQVRLVSALRKATVPVAAPPGTKAKPQLQLELREWPMTGCPLARELLEFLLQRGGELGDLGQPALGDCPPHALWPSTLRKLLGRLDALEVVDAQGGKDAAPGSHRGVVRLRWEAVSYLAFKAVGTTPQAAPEAPGQGAAGASEATPARAARQHAAAKPGTSALAVRLVRRQLDWEARTLQRIVRRGFRSRDADWAEAWRRFCRSRRASPDLLQVSPEKELLAEFVERSLPVLLKKEWARDLMFKPEGQGDGLSPESDMDEPVPGIEDDDAAAGAVELHPRGAAAGDETASRKRPASQESSSMSASTRSKRKRRKKDRKRKHKMKWGDYTSQMSPEVLMMSNMMGSMMMMNNPLAMMGMGAPMMTQQAPLMQPPSPPKRAKKDKGKRAARKEAPPPPPPPGPPGPPASAVAADAGFDWNALDEDVVIDADDL